MGGTLAVRSVVGSGSTFVVTVPARPSAGAAEAEASRLAAPEHDLAVPPMHILLAEDNATNQYLIEACLRRAGHTVEIVGNGAEAVAAAAGGGFDAILMDVQMPELDGPAATRAIRALPGAVATVPIIALTASAMPGDREDCLAAGMTDYLAKPIEFWALYEALGRARRSDEPPEEEAPVRRSA
jgi:CheY-like chemotaxis protein